jgi:hypothetical protein
MAIFDSGMNYYAAFTSQQREYVTSDVDEATTTRYYGFLAYNGYWIIRKLVTTTGAMTYAQGKRGYDTAWTGRAGLTYVRYNEMFV